MIDDGSNNWVGGTEADCVNPSTRFKLCMVAGCGAIVETEKQDALGHDLPDIWTTRTPSTCYADGIEVKECTRCDYEETQGFMDGPIHLIPAEWTGGSAATCLEPSTRFKVCFVSECTAIVETEEQGALGHLWIDNWELTLNPACDYLGEESRACTRDCELDGHIEIRYVTADRMFGIDVIEIDVSYYVIELANLTGDAVSLKGMFFALYCEDCENDVHNEHDEDDEHKTALYWQLPSVIMQKDETLLFSAAEIAPILKWMQLNFEPSSMPKLRLETAAGKEFVCRGYGDECGCVSV